MRSLRARWTLLPLSLLLLNAGCFSSSSSLETEETEISEEATAPSLELLSIDSFFEGTHRPELLTLNGQLYLFVVEPDDSTQHRAYAFTPDAEGLIDLAAPTLSFPLTEEGSDHRVAVVNNEFWVVYQTLELSDDFKPQNATGPMEAYATGQSLNLARFTPEGELLLRTTIVTSDDFSTDTFPDFAILPYDDHLLISTGHDTFPPSPQEESTEIWMTLREVDENGDVLQTVRVEMPTDLETPLIGIGNSLQWDAQGRVLVFTSTHASPENSSALAVATLDESFQVDTVDLFAEDGLELTFPTGNLAWGTTGFWVGLLERPSGGAMDLETNPYTPTLRFISASFDDASTWTLTDLPGFAHVHPTLAVLGDFLFVAWSQPALSGSPQVQVATFEY